MDGFVKILLDASDSYAFLGGESGEGKVYQAKLNKRSITWKRHMLRQLRRLQRELHARILHRSIAQIGTRTESKVEPYIDGCAESRLDAVLAASVSETTGRRQLHEEVHEQLRGFSR